MVELNKRSREEAEPTAADVAFWTTIGAALLAMVGAIERRYLKKTAPRT